MGNKKIGILGGGQLGRMLLQSLPDYAAEARVLESDPNCPASALARVVPASFKNENDVLAFGRTCDVLTIEIEHVHAGALAQLEREGVSVIPSSHVISIIQDKGLQKDFFRQHDIPTSDFILLDSALSLTEEAKQMLPAALKLRKGGYDGKGVQILRDAAAKPDEVFNAPCLLEKLADIEMEVSVIVAVDQKGHIACFPAVEMVFDPVLNLVDYLISPARLSEERLQEAEQLAIKTAKAFGSPGLFAVEMFFTRSADWLVNEVAPRPHNSGHQTIEGNFSSQYDALSRILCGLPLGNLALRTPSLMLNLLGADGYSGPVVYQGLEEAASIPGVYLHLYGKAETRAGRKMGHATIIGNSREDLLNKAQLLKRIFTIKSE
jgi:5-(carboxyamino)imidazole ribonucleotide synthase